jgi:glycosyltransferase involved in cell wall biosynthesis
METLAGPRASDATEAYARHLSASPGAAPLVSVVLIFFNAARFIEEAIASVFGQTYRSWELLLVDDGSVDRSTDIAKAYAGKHPDRVRYLEHAGHQNQRMSASRNLGIRHASGKYIALLDADDVWLPNKLERQVAILESHPDVGLLYGAPLYWRSWDPGRIDGDDYTPSLGVPHDTVFQPPALLTLQLAGAACSPCPSDVLLRHDVVKAVGAFDETFPGLFEDQAFFAKVKLHAPIFVSGECWDRYRLHPESHCAVETRAGRLPAARQRYLEWLTDYLAAHDVRDAAVWRALRSQQWPYRHPVLTRLASVAHRAEARAVRSLGRLARQALSPTVRGYVTRSWRLGSGAPAVGRVRLGDLRRIQPLGRRFGYDRGQPVDRYYIERFLAARAADVRGRVLEVKDDRYTRRFGGERVSRSDVLHLVAGNPKATIVADLTKPDTLPADTFDCAIITQVLPFIRDPQAAVQTLQRIVAPGGAVLATVPGISQIDRHEMERWGDYWRFTSLSARLLFESAFGAEHVTVEAHGNVLAATALLYGLAREELTDAELQARDPDYEVIIAIRAVKPLP